MWEGDRCSLAAERVTVRSDGFRGGDHAVGAASGKSEKHERDGGVQKAARQFGKDWSHARNLTHRSAELVNASLRFPKEQIRQPSDLYELHLIGVSKWWAVNLL
jgi:hypothetical protein